jgi:hypothetical protein
MRQKLTDIEARKLARQARLRALKTRQRPGTSNSGDPNEVRPANLLTVNPLTSYSNYSYYVIVVLGDNGRVIGKMFGLLIECYCGSVFRCGNSF